jgi:hypothetical protein
MTTENARYAIFSEAHFSRDVPQQLAPCPGRFLGAVVRSVPRPDAND